MVCGIILITHYQDNESTTGADASVEALSYRIAGNFRGSTFRGMAREALRIKFRGCNIRVQCRETTHHNLCM